jgi:DNA recombination protein RmuC
MVETLLAVVVLLLFVVLALVIVSMVRGGRVDLEPLDARLKVLQADHERIERGVRDELARARGESAAQARELRGEVGDRLEAFAGELRQSRESSDEAGRELRGEVGDRLEAFAAGLRQFMESSEEGARGLRREVLGLAQTLNETLVRQIEQFSMVQGEQLKAFALQLTALGEATERRMEGLRATVEERLATLQEDNGARLEQIRQTVDERLQGTLEARLGESFRLVSDRLEQVHKGLGEMQTLAAGVGDLKRVLTNVKSRGSYGEVQLGMLLEQVLAPDQYAKNVKTRPGSNDLVEYAVRLPGRADDGEPCWLPIDSKFPTEDYERLLGAIEIADGAGIEAAGKAIESAIRKQARIIRDKYIASPHTTDFAILFLPAEGLFAEVLRRPGLSESLNRECRIVVAGPTTLLAMLNSLQMGFRTLALEKRSAEVWQVLGAVKTEFGRFGGVLASLKKQLQTASNTIEDAATRTRAMDRALKSVEALPAEQSIHLLPPVVDDQPSP